MSISPMTLARLLASVAASIVMSMVCLPVSEAAAQTGETIISPRRALECFVASRKAGRNTSICDSPHLMTVEMMLRRPNLVSPSVVSEVLNGLERLALESDDEKVQSHAATRLTVPGIVDPTGTSGRPLPGIIDRASSVYWRSLNWGVRTSIINGMPRQAERSEAIGFLKRVARDPRPEDRVEDWPAQYIALTMLARMGSDGRSALRELHEGGRLENARARGYLEFVAQHSYQEPQRKRPR